jgi:hypothetical protein
MGDPFKAAIKLHTLLTLQGNFPTVIIVTPGSVHDVNILDQLAWEAGSLHQGSRLSGLRPPASPPPVRCLFRHPRQEKLPLRPPLLPSGGQIHRSAF